MIDQKEPFELMQNYALAGARFIDLDGYQVPPSDPGNLNLYLFCDSDPVNLKDLSGHFGLADFTIAAGISFSLLGGGLWFAGAHFNHPTLAGVGQNTLVFGAGVTLAGVGFMIAPAVGASVIATEIPLFIANLVYTWGQGGLVDQAQSAIASDAVPRFLSDYYFYNTSQSHSLPPSGRIVVRGATRVGDIPDAGGTNFGSAAISLHAGDYVYDYALTGDGSDGGMAVVIGQVQSSGQITVQGNYKFTSGTISALPFAHPLAASPPEILVTK